MGSVLGIFPVRALSRKQTEIRDQITTQGIAPFPQHLQHIAELVGEANVSIDIMADCVDYGSFFEPKTHRELVDKLVKAHKEGVKVRILVCGPPQPITHNSIFFEKEVHHDGTFHDYYTNNQRFREYYEIIYCNC